MAMYCFMYTSPAITSFIRFLCLSVIYLFVFFPLALFLFSHSVSQLLAVSTLLPASLNLSLSLSLYPPFPDIFPSILLLSSFRSLTHIHLISFTAKHTHTHTPFLFLAPSHTFSQYFPTMSYFFFVSFYFVYLMDCRFLFSNFKILPSPSYST